MKQGKTRAKSLLKALAVLLLLTAAAGPAFLLGLFLGFGRDLPSVEQLKSYSPGLVTRVYDINDELLTTFYQERREVVPMENMPADLVNAVIAVEDAKFMSHRGVDPMGIVRAMVKNLLAGEVVQGGSTITQQVARAVFLTPEKKIARKIKEAILAWRLEREFPKRDILWLYLSHIYFGQGAYGVEAAARTYFGKHVSQLGLAECAMLAGLPQAPSRYSPTAHPEAAAARQRLVLGRMVEEGYITEERMRVALERPPAIQPAWSGRVRAPHFTEHVRRYIEREYGSDLLYRGGLRVYTTIDPRLQEAAERAVAAGVREVDHRRGYRQARESIDLSRPGALEEWTRGRRDWPTELKEGEIYPGVVVSVKDAGRAMVKVGKAEGILPIRAMQWVYAPTGRRPRSVGEVLREGNVIKVRVEGLGNLGRPLLALEQDPEVEGALVCLDPGDGHVLAMVGGRDFRTSQFNRAVQSRRQPGSAFKPFIYAAAMERGASPADVLIDSPVVFRNLDEEAKKKKWRPENYDETFTGPIRLREALNQSRNLPTIKLLQKVGLGPVLDLARRLGIRSPLSRDLSLALGSSGVTLMELTGAYGVFVNQGIYTPPMFIRYITDRAGTLLEVHQPRPRRVMDENAAYIITSMLTTVVEDGTGQRVKALNRPCAGKTGTTNEFLDAWFMGFTPQLVTGVWVGLDEEQPIGPKETGSRAAAPLWLAFMEEAVRDMPVEIFRVPPGVIYVKVDEASGKLAAPGSRSAIFEVFPRGSEPRETARPERPNAADFLRMEAQ